MTDLFLFMKLLHLLKETKTKQSVSERCPVSSSSASFMLPFSQDALVSGDLCKLQGCEDWNSGLNTAVYALSFSGLIASG